MIPILVLLLTLGWSFYSLSPSSLLPRQDHLASSSAPKPAMSTISIRGCWPSFGRSIFRATPTSSFRTCPERLRLIAANQVYNVAKPDGLTSSGDLSGAVFRSAHEETGSEIRLGEMELAWQPGNFQSSPVYARRHAVQDRLKTCARPRPLRNAAPPVSPPQVTTCPSS